MIKYFYVERTLGTNAFSINPWIVINNLLSLLILVQLVIVAAQIYYDYLHEKIVTKFGEDKDLNSLGDYSQDLLAKVNVIHKDLRPKFNFFHGIILANAVCAIASVGIRLDIVFDKSNSWDPSLLEPINLNDPDSCLEFPGLTAPVLTWFDHLFFACCILNIVFSIVHVSII